MKPWNHEIREEVESMFKSRFLQTASAFLLFIAASGISTACWFAWYQPKLPE